MLGFYTYILQPPAQEYALKSTEAEPVAAFLTGFLRKQAQPCKCPDF
jgi:hypothetical protein